jgi:hypothetical protein
MCVGNKRDLPGALDEHGLIEKMNLNAIQVSKDPQQRCERNIPLLSVADPGSGIRCLFDPWIRDPGSGIGFFRIPDYGSQTQIFESLVTIFWVKSFFLQHFKTKIIFNFVKFVAT